MSAYDDIPALNWTTLARLATSPALLRWRLEHPEPESAAYRLGRAVHCAVLEPEAWPARYAAAPECDRRTREGKATYAAFTEQVGDAEVLKADEHALAETCAQAVAGHRVAAELLRGGRAEEMVEWTDAGTGIACKGRLDCLRPDRLIDLKTTRRATVREFVRDVAAYLYHGQVAWYLDGAIAAGLLPADASAYIIAVQTVEPYDVMAMRLTTCAPAADGFVVRPGSLDAGRALYRALLTRYCACRAADLWPGVAPDLIDLDLPPWALSATADEGGDW